MVVADEQHATVCIAHHARLLGVLDGVRADAPADPVQKRDLRGSDKIYPPILPGDPAKVWIVEGGP
ncbi:hypothetical protein, partial [Aeromonas caviae]|uniref:hypothetical protein n=1 Tax=Aeromonas caviae TaxID=648 RepID=UPI001CC4A178